MGAALEEAGDDALEAGLHLPGADGGLVALLPLVEPPALLLGLLAGPLDGLIDKVIVGVLQPALAVPRVAEAIDDNGLEPGAVGRVDRREVGLGREGRPEVAVVETEAGLRRLLALGGGVVLPATALGVDEGDAGVVAARSAARWPPAT